MNMKPTNPCIECDTNWCRAQSEGKECPAMFYVAPRKWIPCSERLPEEGQKIYLVTIDYGNGLSCVAPRFFWDEKRLWNEAEEYITAWMPLPEPYKEEGDGKC